MVWQYLNCLYLGHGDPKAKHTQSKRTFNFY